MTFEEMYQMYDYYMRMTENPGLIGFIYGSDETEIEHQKLSYLKAAKHIEKQLEKEFI